MMSVKIGDKLFYPNPKNGWSIEVHVVTGFKQLEDGKYIVTTSQNSLALPDCKLKDIGLSVFLSLGAAARKRDEMLRQRRTLKNSG